MLSNDDSYWLIINRVVALQSCPCILNLANIFLYLFFYWNVKQFLICYENAFFNTKKCILIIKTIFFLVVFSSRSPCLFLFTSLYLLEYVRFKKLAYQDIDKTQKTFNDIYTNGTKGLQSFSTHYILVFLRFCIV